MAKAIIHAESSAKRWGGKAEDYLAIHEWFDQTKAIIGDNRHRAILHNTFGIFLCEQVFGVTITNSNGRQIPVRSIGEQHMLEDFNGKIPTLQDYVESMEHEDWMDGKGYPPSAKKIEKKRLQKVLS